MLQFLRIVSVVVGFVIVLGAAYLFFNGVAEAPESIENPSRDTSELTLPSPGDSPALIVKRTILKDTHTVEGTVALPNPCYFMDVSVTVSSSTPAVATLEISTADEGGICIQVIDERPFSVSFDALGEVTLRAAKDGVEIPIRENLSDTNEQS